MTFRTLFALTAALTAAATACGGSGDSSDAAPSPTDARVTTTADTTVPPPTLSTSTSTPTVDSAVDGAELPGDETVASYGQIQPAVVQIWAAGSLRDPEVGQTTSAGAGTGFFVAPGGYAVTNNHVVTGVATLEVYVGGDTSESYNAQVVGVSECNDLALIQVDVDDHPVLAWSDEPSAVGTEVYAAGFPLTNPEYTLTRGIVAKASAGGDTSWTSVDRTIEHDAVIQPGNSGGPLVDADGAVVGVNYSVGGGVTSARYFAIESGLARDVVDRLYDGDFESLGINGTAVLDEDSGIAGVWVSGVAAGSPASAAGLRPGDIVTRLNGLPLATDGTMRDYCDVIRTAGEGTPMSVEVLRFDTQEILEGEINGDRELTATVSFAEQAAAEVGEEPAGAGDPSAGYTEYVQVVDDAGTIAIDVPAEWNEVSTEPLDFGAGPLPVIVASPSLADFEATYTTSGLLYTAMPGALPTEESLADFAPDPAACPTDAGYLPYEDDVYVGHFQIWTDCGGIGASHLVLIANTVDESATIVLGAQIVTDADWDAVDRAFGSMLVAVG